MKPLQVLEVKTILTSEKQTAVSEFTVTIPCKPFDGSRMRLRFFREENSEAVFLTLDGDDPSEIHGLECLDATVFSLLGDLFEDEDAPEIKAHAPILSHLIAMLLS